LRARVSLDADAVQFFLDLHDQRPNANVRVSRVAF
jgi:hypothetical protein